MSYAPQGRGASEPYEPLFCHFYQFLCAGGPLLIVWGSLLRDTGWGGDCNEAKNNRGIGLRYGRSL